MQQPQQSQSQPRGRSQEPVGARRTSSARRGTSSRDSSVSSEVRCGCQYFQTDSLLPERLARAGRPTSRTAFTSSPTGTMTTVARTMGDHEYEPISPPPDIRVIDPDEPEIDVRKSSTGSQEQQPPDTELADKEPGLPADGEMEDAVMGGQEVIGESNEAENENDSLSAQEIQNVFEERFLNTPTTESRTDCEINTSQVDSSGLEDLPLKRGARKKSGNGDSKGASSSTDLQTRARGLQIRLRSQAGKIRQKLKSVPKPSFERPKFNLPERPKFNFPDRPKFSLPDRPKFHLPERPKFNLPERPKFNLPERPKFNIQRPKLPSLPSSVSSTISKQKSRFTSTRRPLKERSTTNPSSESTASSKRNIFSLRSYPRIFDKKRKVRELSSSKSTRSQTPPPKMLTKKRGSMGARWLHKFKDRFNEDRRNDFEDDENLPADKPTYHMDPETVIVREIPLKDEPENVENIESVEVERKFPHSSALEENILKMKQAQMQRSESQIASDAEQRSSGSSSERHRAGVLEEIDSDEFFLREKGLSQEDVEMGRYLTSEIRDAFRPPISSLSQIESYPKEEEDNLALQYRGTPEREPIRPARRSLKKKPSEDETESEPIQIEESAHYYNFPPIRPERMKKSFKQESEEQEEYEDHERNEEEMDDEEMDLSSKQESQVPELNQPLKFKAPSLIITDTDEHSLPHTEGMEDEEPDDEGEWADEEERDYEEDEKAPSPPLPATPPLPPKRYRRSRKEHYEATFNGHYTKEDWLENVDNNIVPEDIMALRMESDYIMPANQMHGYYDSPPVPPKRERKKSSRTTSLADEDRTSRGADSLPFERDQELLADKYIDDIPFADIPSEDYQELPTERYIGSRERVNKVVSEEISRSEPQLKHEYDLGDLGGYATVEKTYPKPVQRQKKEKNGRPAPPVRRKKIGGHNFFSWPRKTMHTPPQRPRRNYSTLGPARPPRRRSSSLQSESYMEIEDHDSHEARNLQSGDVIEKMKSRPLPPPPRPPRRGREERYLFDEQDYTEDLNIEKEFAPMAALKDSVFYSQERTISNEKIEQINELIPHPEEVSIAIQTDPVPDDFYIEDLEYSQEQPPITADAYTETKQEIEDISPSSPTPEEQHSIKTGKGEPVPSVDEFYQESIIPKSFISPQESLPPPTIIERQVPVFIKPESGSEVDVLRTSRLQVGELDVSRINVGELQAQKIVVSDIDGVSMSISELTSKSGHLIINGMELPASVLQEMKEIKDAIAAIRINPPSQQTIYISSSQTQTSEIPATNEQLPTDQISDATIVQRTSTKEIKDKDLEKQQSSEKIDQTIDTEAKSPKEKEIPSSEKDLPKQQTYEKSEQKIDSEDKSPKETITKESLKSHETISSSDKQSIPLEHDYHSQEPTVNIQQPSSSQSTAQERSTEANYQIPPGYIPTPGSIPPFTNPIFISSIDTLLPGFYRGLHSRVQPRTASSPELESDEEYVYIPGHRRRRHQSKAVQRSSSDEESSQINQSRRLRHQDEQNVMELTRQFVRVVHGNSQKAVIDLVKFISSHLPESEDDRRDLQRALFILFILLTGLFILGFGSEKTVHYHHWDYMPPP